MIEMILFCLPYAGGSATIYNKWVKKLPASVKLFPLEIAGRGKRSNEPLPTSVDEVVQDLFQTIYKLIEEKTPYAIFGHSMGSLLAYELIHQIKAAALPEPRAVFFSGRSAPHVNYEKRNVHLMPEQQFQEEILQIGGIPQEFFENKVLSELFIPIIRSDYRLIETYQYTKKTCCLNCDFIILHGESDTTTMGRMDEWQLHTSMKSQVYAFSGGHFFIHEHENAVLSLIQNILLGVKTEGV
jgi:medium-chain acyl-[acyl-carrier-protein] hydrolase